MNDYLMRTWSCTVRLVVDDERALPAAAAELTSMLARSTRSPADSVLTPRSVEPTPTRVGPPRFPRCWSTSSTRLSTLRR